MKKVKLGLLACGGIANKMARAVPAAPNVELYACAARDLSRAEEFAAKYNIPKAYGSYQELVNDSEIGLIYVSTPHSHHYEAIKLCLEGGKNVICEKPFTPNAKQAEELFALAKSKGLFLMEAMWTRFLPAIKELKKMVDGGIIGELLTANLTSGQDLRHVPRLNDPALAGGALLDMGIYSITFPDLFMGEDIKEIHSSARISDKGVDLTNVVLFDYGNGKCASVMSSCLAAYAETSSLLGTDGYIILNGFGGLTEFTVVKKGVSTTYSFPNALRGNGFEHELMEAADCILAGKLESDILPGSKTIHMMGLLDRIRKPWGVVYPFEK